MKYIRTLSVLLLIGSASAQQPQPATELPRAQITFHVITDAAKPVPNVEVTASTFLRWQPGEGFGKDIYTELRATTDEKGVASVTLPSERGDLRYGIYNATGFYSTRNLEYQFKEVSEGKWHPWNPIVDVVLKPIVSPISMYARLVGNISRPLEIPIAGKPVGFDLIVGDWIAPYGRGTAADMVFTMTEVVPFKSVDKPFNTTLTILFSNEGDGIQSVLVPINRGSDLRLPRYAPEAGYGPTLIKRIARLAEGEPMVADNREDQNYFFRVRTVLDQNGNIKSALYGKISGEIRFWPDRGIRFSYYLNPNSNDRNMEFDPENNLAGDLPFNQRVTAP